MRYLKYILFVITKYGSSKFIYIQFFQGYALLIFHNIPFNKCIIKNRGFCSDTCLYHLSKITGKF